MTTTLPLRPPRTHRAARLGPVPYSLLGVAAAAYLDLVVDPGALRELEREVPQVGAVQPTHRELLGQPDHALHQPDLVDVAAVQERAPRSLDDGYLVACQEPVDR